MNNTFHSTVRVAAVLSLAALPAALPAQHQDLVKAEPIEDASACDDACIEKLRDTEYRLAIALGVFNDDLESSELQVRKLDRSEPYRGWGDLAVTGVQDGEGVLWQAWPVNIARALWKDWQGTAKEGFEMRIRVVSKTKGAKNCPSVKIRMPHSGQDWQQYDESSKSWKAAPWTSAKQTLMLVPLQGLQCR